MESFIFHSVYLYMKFSSLNSRIKLNMKLSFILITIQLLSFSSARPTSPKPNTNTDSVPVFARWLVNQSSWGVLSTLDSNNAPFGNVVSYSDGPTGIPYFFLTTMFDPTGINAHKNPKSSFTLSEYPLGSCQGTLDPQSPNCSKITLNGKLKKVPLNSREEVFARSTLFTDHPQLNRWPTKEDPVGFPMGKGFRVFRLEIESIFLVNAEAPRRNITVAQYLNAHVS